MSLVLIVWVSVALFLVHEFEEISCIRPWLARHHEDPRARRQVFWSFRTASTSVIAAMIFEEYLIFTAIALVVTMTERPAVFAGLLIPYALHLVSHIAEAVRLRMRTPSVVSSALTLPWYLYAIASLIRQTDGRYTIAVWTIVFTVVIAANFALIYRMKPHLQKWLTEQPNGSLLDGA